VTGAWSESFNFYKRQIMILLIKHKNIRNIVWPRQFISVPHLPRR